MSSRIRFVGLLSAVVGLVAVSAADAQVVYTWNNTGTDWTLASSWTPASGPPGTSDTALFTAPTTAGAINNPVLNSSSTVAQLNIGSSPVGWSLSGTGSLTSGASASVGIATRSGSGTTTIDLGNGTANSLILNGPTGTTTGGNVQIGSNSSLVFTGNTVATGTTGSGFNVRGGTLVLDNSAGNPTSQRLTAAGNFTLAGGGSTLELRGAASGTNFSGLTGALASAGSGNTYLRTVQNGTGSLSVNFTTANRTNTSGIHYYENIGSGLVGDSGKPTVTATTAPTTRQGLISTSAATTIPWALVTNRATDTAGAVVTGRWANYNSGIVAGVTTSFTGEFGSAAAGTNVLFNPSSAGTVTQSVSGNQLAAVVFEPGVAGVTYALGTNQINTLAVAHSGANDLAVTGGSLFSTGTAGTRALTVLSPGASLITDSNIAANASPLTIGGAGFVILNGSSTQLAFPSTQSLNLAGGTLRGTASNLVFTTTSLRFRGGVLEYDVSAANATFNLALGTAASTVNWTANAGDAASTNVGGGGFSAFSTVPANSLTVNLGGASAPLIWNDTGGAFFVTNGNALKFGSSKSNATVIFQNPISLGTSTTYQARDINVTGGLGNAEDKTILSGVVSGPAGIDLVKTGSGVLELSATNTYTGNTQVTAGEVRVTGTQSGLTTYNVAAGAKATVGATGNVQAAIGTTGLNSILANGSGKFGFTSLSTLKLSDLGSFNPTAAGTYNLVTLSSGVNLELNGSTISDGTVIGTYVHGTGTSGAVLIDPSSLALTSGDTLTLQRTGNNLVLNFAPVPEPGTILAVSAGVLGLGAFLRKKFAK